MSSISVCMRVCNVNYVLYNDNRNSRYLILFGFYLAQVYWQLFAAIVSNNLRNKQKSLGLILFCFI